MLAAPPTWSASFVPMAIGYVCAFVNIGETPSVEGVFWIVVSFTAMILIETGKHAVNDLVDYRSGNDIAVDEEHRTPFSGGKKVLLAGILTEKETAAVAVLTLGAAAVMGLAIVWFWTPRIFWIGVAGVVISVIYTLPPVKLCYRGLGEVAVGITYGPLILMGAYLMFAEDQWLFPLMLSLHIGYLITNVLVINEYPDYEADVAAGKKNLIARVGKQRGLRWYGGIFVASYVPLVILSLYIKEVLWLVPLVLVPLMAYAWRNCCRYYNDISQLIRSNDMTIKIHMFSGLLLMAAMLVM